MTPNNDIEKNNISKLLIRYPAIILLYIAYVKCKGRDCVCEDADVEEEDDDDDAEEDDDEKISDIIGYDDDDDDDKEDDDDDDKEDDDVKCDWFSVLALITSFAVEISACKCVKSTIIFCNFLFIDSGEQVRLHI